MNIEEAYEKRREVLFESMEEGLKEKLILYGVVTPVMLLVRLAFKLGYYEGAKYGTLPTSI